MRLPVKKPVVLVQPGGQEAAGSRAPSRRSRPAGRPGDPADAHPALGQARPGPHLEQVHDRLALAQRSRGKTVVAARSLAKVATNMRWLAIRFSSSRITRRYFARSGTSRPDQLLHRLHVGQVVGGAAEVVEPVGIGEELRVGAGLADLLHPAVEVADDGAAVGHDLALEVSSSRSTPCVLGCCGPIFRMTVSVCCVSPRARSCSLGALPGPYLSRGCPSQSSVSRIRRSSG